MTRKEIKDMAVAAIRAGEIECKHGAVTEYMKSLGYWPDIAASASFVAMDESGMWRKGK